MRGASAEHERVAGISRWRTWAAASVTRSIPLRVLPFDVANVIHYDDEANDRSAREIAMLCDHDADGRRKVLGPLILLDHLEFAPRGAKLRIVSRR